MLTSVLSPKSVASGIRNLHFVRFGVTCEALLSLRQESGMAGRRLEALDLMVVEKSELTALAARPKTAQALAQRARIILACAEGLENKAVGQRLGVHPHTVGKWRRRFLDQRDCATNRAPVRRARSTMRASKR